MPVAQYRQPDNIPNISDSSAMNIIKRKAISRIMNVFNGTVFPVQQSDIFVYPQSVGLIKRLYVVVTATLTNTSGVNTAHLTDGAAANLLSNVRFYDTQQFLRHDTNGLHLTMVSSLKRNRPFAGGADWNKPNGNSLSEILNTNPASWQVIQAPATIAPNTSATVRAIFEVPIAYSDKDFRGILFAQSVNATMSLYLQFNQQAFVDTVTTPTLDDTFAVYNGASGTFTSAQVGVYQDFYDQLPRDSKTNAYILPKSSISTAYMLTRSTTAGVVPNQESYISYQNFRLYMSRFLIYNNSGATGGRTYGTDIQYLREISANFAPYFQYDPLFAAFRTREILTNDLPAGTYYFPARHNPIYTTQTGNRLTGVYPTVAGAGAYISSFDEFFGNQNVLMGAASAV
jgi:hypothetical protein